ncbi:sigma-E factor negative regulatory protein [Acidovorax sp. A1169]|uniref:sigma-E factor negative regulatory protein n=1 Tax=Acidovorax sp. A1169 TaxID=3059524 RepID=UPI002737BAFA|nr:sigma-E factor negative regulatory protein [Acidovorax sp. A1169]MDP4073391.1 sigma-E factor negative regulatory protein [Acidovorax sp. A1169]
MNNDVMTTKREQISALADGQLHGDAFADAIACTGDDEGLATWQIYHLVGDVLRSNELARADSGNVLLSRLREQMAQEAPVRSPAALAPEPALGVVAQARLPAANASVFRWKMVAGVASLAAVAAIGWSSVGMLQGGRGVSGAQMASVGAPVIQAAPAPQGVMQPGSMIAVAENEGQQVMIRDPRLDELLAAHKQFGSTSALQMPAGFLRNATFATPSR